MCSACPEGAICYGNMTIVPDSGYWRSGKYKDKFWKCPISSACTGSPDYPDKIDYTGSCAKGYEGNMCHSCVNDYARNWENECA